MKLYYAPGSCALAAHIALEEVGADYAAERIDLKAGQQTSAGYLAVNPKGRVPALTGVPGSRSSRQTASVSEKITASN